MCVYLCLVAGRRWRNKGDTNVSGENLCQLQSVGKPVQADIALRTDLQHSFGWLMLRQALRVIMSAVISHNAAAMLHCKVGSQSILDVLTFICGQKGRKKHMTVCSVLYLKIKYT